MKTHATLAAAVFLVSGTGTATAAELKSFKPCDLCAEMVVIPPGNVTAGNPKDFDEGEAASRPTLTLAKGFALARTETTQALWEWVMGSNPSGNKGANNPVEHVDWKMVQDFIAKLNKKTGKTFRLPTEKEWEYAARAGNSASYSFGEDEKQLDQYAWYVANSGGKSHPVAQKKPNAFGLYDMHGNVWEWTADCYGANFFAQLPAHYSKEWEEGCYRVTRGGSALNLPMAVTSFYRASLKQPLHNENLGFRLAMSVE